MATLYLLEGPAGSGKSQVAAEMVEAGEVDIVSDVTRLWVALGLYERGPDGRFPIREANDPALIVALYVQTVAVRRALSEGYDVAVTTSRRNMAPRWGRIAHEFAASLTVRTVDPGEAVVRARLAEPDGRLSDPCREAIARWYG